MRRMRYSFPALHTSFQNCACVIDFVHCADITCALGSAVRLGVRSSRMMSRLRRCVAQLWIVSHYSHGDESQDLTPPRSQKQTIHELFEELVWSKIKPRATMKKSPPAGKMASAYRFPDRMVLHSQARLPGWALAACEPYLTLPRDAVAEDVGRAVQTVIAGFRAEAPQPDDFKQVTAAFVRGVGARSHKQLQESSISCSIMERDGRLEFQPYHNGGTSGDTKGFQPISGAQFSLAADSAPAEIGATLVRCFALCTTIYMCD